MSIATPTGVTTIRRHPPPKPAAGNPGKPTRRNEEPRDGQPNKQPMTPAQPKPDQRHRSKWHQKLGTLLSSQETDTHHPEPAFRTSPVRGNFSKLPVPARLVNFAFAADLAVPSRVSLPRGDDSSSRSWWGFVPPGPATGLLGLGVRASLAG